MDCNPRVGMNFRMFENDAGIDVVRAQHLNLTGRNFPSSTMIQGKLFVVESYYLLSLIRGGSRVTAIDGKCRAKEYAWWSLDDALPFVVMSVRLFAQTTTRTLRYVWNFAVSQFKR